MWILDIANELRVVGNDPEAADISNPRGDIIREVWFVTAESQRGEILAHVWSTESRAEAAGWLASIRGSVQRTPGWDPSNRRAWHHWRYVYGSEAFLVNERDEAEREKQDALDSEAATQ